MADFKLSFSSQSPCFEVWRGVIAMAHADGRVDQLERDYVEEHLKYQPITAEQYHMLQRDFQSSPKVNNILDQIQYQRDLRALIFHASELMHVDGNIHPKELKLLSQYQKKLKKSPKANKRRFKFKHTLGGFAVGGIFANAYFHLDVISSFFEIFAAMISIAFSF